MFTVWSLLRLEAAVVLVAAVLVYARLDLSWLTFTSIFFLPDLALIAYLAGPAIGASFYNITHSYLGPLVLVISYVTFDNQNKILGVALVWVAHIAFDRMLGFGLKRSSGFNTTHLGQIGSGKSLSDD